MKLQRVDTKSVPVLYLGSLDSSTGTIVIPFRFASPGVRAMLSLKALVVQRGSVPPFDWTFFGTVSWFMWLVKTVIDKGSSQRVPVQNLLGTRANPARLDDGSLTPTLNGVSIDVSGIGGDGVDGELTCLIGGTSGETNPTFVYLRGRYNAVAPLCDEEWAQIAARAGSSPDARFTSVGTSLG